MCLLIQGLLIGVLTVIQFSLSYSANFDPMLKWQTDFQNYIWKKLFQLKR